MSKMLGQRIVHNGTFWIVVGLLAGVLLGGSFPQDEYPRLYQCFHFCSNAFISLIKGLIIPLLISTIVVGIAQTGDIRSVGRMGIKTLLYFEVITTIALFVGMLLANWLRPGEHLPLDLGVSTAVLRAQPQTGWDIVLHALPSNVVKHAAEGNILAIVVFATLFGVSITQIGPVGKTVLTFFEGVAQAMFSYTHMVMKLAPLGVFGAMAYNVSHMASGYMSEGVLQKGWHAVGHLLTRYAMLVGSYYAALALLIGLVFVPILSFLRVPVLSFFRAIREPLLTAFSTTSSEAALPQLLEETVKFGVPRRVAGFVLPAGYSFNLDASTLYLVLASLTIAQAAKVEMSFEAQLAMLLTLVLTSKGVAGVPRGSLVILAATCDSFGLPAEAGVAMLLAVDSIMDMARSAVNVMGNGVATVAIARWEGVFLCRSPETEQVESKVLQ